jgi:hypothetical protein
MEGKTGGIDKAAPDLPGPTLGSEALFFPVSFNGKF